MKVYVVTSGSYSDYTIQKIFTDKAKAEEYKEWLDDSNDIEEYETEDGLVVNKYYRVLINYTKYNNQETAPSIRVTKQTFKDNYIWYSEGIDWQHNAYSELSLVRCIQAQNWNEEFYRNKFTKAIYDLMAIAQHHRAEGASVEDVQKLFENCDE